MLISRAKSSTMRASSFKRKSPASCCSNQRDLFDHSVIAHAIADTKLCTTHAEKARCIMFNVRQAKGLEKPTSQPLETSGGVWIVPSQSSPKKYTVNLHIQTCTCADFEAHRVKCKHIYAVEYSLQHDNGMALPESEKRPKPTYKQEWHEYNLAQTNEKAQFQELLYALCQGIEEHAQTFGRPRLPLSDMLFAIVMKVYCGFSSRRTISDLREAQQRGYLSRAPHFNSISNYMEADWLTAYLHALITESSLPLKSVETSFAVDSSGLSTCRYGRWITTKYGKEQISEKQGWVKLHLMCGVNTNVVTSCVITDQHAGDSPRFNELVNKTAENFVMNEVSADKAYSSRP